MRNANTLKVFIHKKAVPGKLKKRGVPVLKERQSIAQGNGPVVFGRL
jgi:hypothetical protein